METPTTPRLRTHTKHTHGEGSLKYVSSSTGPGISPLSAMRTFNLVALGAAVALPRSDGFISPTGLLLSPPSRASHHSAARSHTMSYQDKLREAQAARGQQGSPIPPAAAGSPAAKGGGGTKPADLPAVAESPFSLEIQEELRTAITILSARLQREKPMTRAEFERFESAVAIIVEDASPTQELPTQAAPPAAAAAAAAPTAAAVVSAPFVSDPDDVLKPMDELESEGPAWDAKKAVQYGLPAGVQNSYVIEDMGKMNPEEYQEALRKKVISRAQSARKTGAYGNIVANEYLKFLGKNPMEGDEVFREAKKTVGERGHESFEEY